MKKSLYWLPFLLYSIILVKLLLTPADQIPPILMSQGDKILHLSAFAGLKFFYMAAVTSFFSHPKTDFRFLILSFIGLSAAGGLIEFLQMLVPGRNGSLMDFVFNTIGLVIGLLISFIFLSVVRHFKGHSLFKE